MSLFERIKNKRYDLQEVEKKFPPKDEGSSNNTSNTTTETPKSEPKKIKKKITRRDRFEDLTGEGIKTGNYPKTRKELEAKRKEYGIDKDGKPSKEGIKRYAEKAKQLKSGSNVPVNVTQSDLDRAKRNMVGGEPVKNKAGKVIGTTTGKIGGKLNPLATKAELDAIKAEIKKSKTMKAKPLPKVYDAKASKELGTDVFKPIRKTLPRKQTTKVINTPTRRIQLLKPKIIPPKDPPKVKGNLFDPTGRIADETKKANQSFKDFIRKLKTKHPKPKLSLYDPLKTKINVEPLKPLRTFVKPSVTKTATKSKGLIPKLLKAASKNPKAALGVGLLTLGTYGMVKNRKKAPVKNKNKGLVTPLPKKDEIITRPVSKEFSITGNPNRKPIPPKKM